MRLPKSPWTEVLQCALCSLESITLRTARPTADSSGVVLFDFSRQ